MNSVERVKYICKERKIALSRLEKDLGFGNGYIGQLKKGSLPDDRLSKIASYLSVPVEYLLYGDDTEKAPTPQSERQMASIDPAYFRVIQDAQGKGLTPEDLRIAIDFLDRARRRDQ